MSGFVNQLLNALIRLYHFDSYLSQGVRKWLERYTALPRYGTTGKSCRQSDLGRDIGKFNCA